MGTVSLGVVCAALAIQIDSGVPIYFGILFPLLLINSAYVLYDILRAIALNKLASYSKPKQEELARMAEKFNVAMISKLQQSFAKFGIEDTGAEGPIEARLFHI